MEAEEVKIIKKNCGIKRERRKEKGEAIVVWEEDTGGY